MKPEILRNRTIIDMRIAGKSLREIGEEYGITKQRVQAIIQKQLRLNKKGRKTFKQNDK